MSTHSGYIIASTYTYHILGDPGADHGAEENWGRVVCPLAPVSCPPHDLPLGLSLRMRKSQLIAEWWHIVPFHYLRTHPVPSSDVCNYAIHMCAHGLLPSIHYSIFYRLDSCSVHSC